MSPRKLVTLEPLPREERRPSEDSAVESIEILQLKEVVKDAHNSACQRTRLMFAISIDSTECCLREPL